MQVPIQSIQVSQRVRAEVGDLTQLMESMRKYGQLSPILLTRDYELIAGHRRLLAARNLGWTSVEATLADRDSPVEKLEMELQENVYRKDFSPSELLEGYRRLEKLMKPGIFGRLRQFFRRTFGWLFRLGRRPSRGRGLPESTDEQMGI